MAEALINAAVKNDVALVKELIGTGADVNGVDDDERTALFCAADGGFVECGKLLLEANADVNKVDNREWTPLHIASYGGHAECVKLLVDWKANVNAKANHGYSPLHWAAGGGKLACVEILFRAVADLDQLDNYGRTSLAFAILCNRRDAAELLVDKGAKMSKVARKIPKWMDAIVTKRQNVRRSLITFIGVLRKRFTVSGGGTEYTRGRLPRDVVGVISRWAWTTRFDGRWKGALPEKKLKL